ncbi:MAG: CBS domain-containing protein [Candidatus Bathyarchaeota archaeon]|jgi:CBS domain-containing protein|nr:CBS domain-containing protein [Candidatus Bathyarchaeota archaeon A05DMB-3]MDH7607384.1 CBS domain-containing protein [Candidatus Bathyarchaeota archaeon]
MKKLTTVNVKVSRVMTKNLVTVSLGSTVEEAVKRMIDFDVECLPVVDSKGKLQGLLTFRDIIIKAVYSQADVKKLKVEDIMTKDLVTCNLKCTVLDVVKTMKSKHLRRIPVVNTRNKLVGLITDFDLALFGWDFK